MTGTIIAALAAHASALAYEELPAEVVEKTKICILDALGMGVGGVEIENAGVAHRALGALAAPGAATVWVTGEKIRAIDCVLPNSVGAHCFLQDDWDPISHAHIGVAVVPTVFAMAEERGRSGREALIATVGGYEVESRTGVCSVAAFTRGFRASSVYAYFGAATAAGLLAGLDADRLKNALGCAGGVAGGVLQPWVDGSMEWAYQEAFAARAGILAVMLAENGFRGADAIIEGPRGINVCFSGTTEGSEQALAGLGERFFILETCFKRFATGGANQGSAAVAWHLHHNEGVDWQKIRTVRVKIPDTGTHERMNYAGIVYQGPFHTLDQCLISKPFAIACLLKAGALDINTVIRHQDDPEIVDLAHRIELTEDTGIDGWQLEMALELENGTQVLGDGSHIDHTHLYLNRELATEKFLGLASPRLGEAGARAVADLVFEIEELDSLAPITERLVPA